MGEKRERSRIEDELYQQTKHLHSFSATDLERVVDGDCISISRRDARVDVVFPSVEVTDLL